MTSLLRVDGIKKRYGARVALEGVSFRAERGEIIALLGRNGAGKTTLMNILSGYIAMTEGTATVDGKDVQREAMEARKRVGYLPEQPPLYPDLTVTEYLRYCAALKGIPRTRRNAEVAQVIERAELGEYAKRLSGRLSKGYRQRLGMAQALLGAPQLLILDEPGSGLDPLQMVRMRELIREAGQTCTVLLSSHMLSEVTDVASRALVLERGHLRYDGEMAHLLNTRGCVRVTVRGGENIIEKLETLGTVERLPDASGAETLLIHHSPKDDPRGEIARIVVEGGGELLLLEEQHESLEGAFLHLLSEEERP